MRTAAGLTMRIMTMKFPWNLWVGILSIVNVAGGLYFVGIWEGRAALGAILGAFAVMWLIYARRGFVRLLGLGHIIFWTPLLAYFVWSLASNSLESDIRFWMGAVLAVNTVSLVIDWIDVVRYARGERQPI